MPRHSFMVKRQSMAANLQSEKVDISAIEPKECQNLTGSNDALDPMLLIKPRKQSRVSFMKEQRDE